MTFSYYTTVYPSLPYEDMLAKRALPGTVTVPPTLKIAEDDRGEYYQLTFNGFSGLYFVPKGTKTLWTTDEHGNKKSMSVFTKP